MKSFYFKGQRKLQSVIGGGSLAQRVGGRQYSRSFVLAASLRTAG